MPEIRITVANKVAQTIGAPVIICGNSDYTVSFSFDSEWDAYDAKTLYVKYYRRGKKICEEILFDGDSVTLPIIRDTDEISIGVYAGNLRTTTGARVACERCVTDGAAVHDPLTPDVYNQLMEYLAALQNGCCGISELEFIGSDTSEIGIAEPEEELSAIYLNAPLAMLSMDSPDISLSEPAEIEPQIEETEGI